MSSRRTAACITFLLGLALVGSAGGAWACSPRAQMSVNPTSGPGGSTATVEGSRFLSGPVELRWQTERGMLLATPNGPSFSTSVEIPDVEPGFYYILGISRDENGTTAIRQAQFEVVATPSTTTTTAKPPAATSEQSGSGSPQQASSEPAAAAAGGPSSPSAAPSPAAQNSSVPTAGPPAPSPPAAKKAAETAKAPTPAVATEAAETAAAPAPPEPDAPGWTGVPTGIDHNQGDMSSTLAPPAQEDDHGLPTQAARSKALPRQWAYLPLILVAIAAGLGARRRGRLRMSFS